MLEIKPKLKDRYAMHTWLKKLRHFMRTTLSHKFIRGIEKCHEIMLMVWGMDQNKKVCFPFSIIRIDHMVEQNQDIIWMTRSIMLLTHISYSTARKLNHILSKI